MRTIAFLNKKGGVGKTSTCHHLAGTLARRGLRILLVDADPQASLTQGLLGPGGRPAVEAARDDRGPVRRRRRRRHGEPGPADQRSRRVARGRLEPDGQVQRPGPWTTGDSQYILRDALREVGGDFDLTLIDCPPHIHLCAWSALVAARRDRGPAPGRGLRGAGGRRDPGVDRPRPRRGQPSADRARLPVTMFNKSLAVHAAYEADLRAIYGDDVFETVVPLAKDFKEAVTLRKPVVAYKPRSAAAKAIEALADELLARLDARVADDSRRVA